MKKVEMKSAMVYLVGIVSARFVLDGMSLTILGQNITFGHVDSLTYAAILGPILASHGYVQVKGPKEP